jgi:hypothetical protein
MPHRDLTATPNNGACGVYDIAFTLRIAWLTAGGVSCSGTPVVVTVRVCGHLAGTVPHRDLTRAAASDLRGASSSGITWLYTSSDIDAFVWPSREASSLAGTPCP